MFCSGRQGIEVFKVSRIEESIVKRGIYTKLLQQEPEQKEEKPQRNILDSFTVLYQGQRPETEIERAR